MGEAVLSGRNDKIKLLISIHRLSIGGVQKSLLFALSVLDYDRYEVTLYVRQDRCDFLPQVDPRVNKVIVNKDPTRYYRKPRAVLLFLILKLFGLFKKDTGKIKRRLIGL